MKKSVNLKCKWSIVSQRDRNLILKFIKNANKYSFVPNIDTIHLDQNKEDNDSNKVTMINWVTNILLFSSKYNEYEFSGDLSMKFNGLTDDHIEIFCNNIDNGISAYCMKPNENIEDRLVYGYCRNNMDILDEIILIIFEFYMIQTEPKIDVFRISGNKLSFNGYKLLLNTIQNKFLSLRMLVLSPTFDDKCCRLLADFFLKTPDHKMDQIWLTAKHIIN